MLARMKAAGMIGGSKAPDTPAAHTDSSTLVSTSSGGVRRFASPTKRSYMDDEDDAAAGKMVGIGLLFQQNRAYGKLPTVAGVEPNGGAARCKQVAVGDQLETIDGEEVRYMQTEAIARRLMGSENSAVALGLLRRGANGGAERIAAIEVTRSPIPHTKKGMTIPNSLFGAIDPGINLASVLSNMRASARLPDDEEQAQRSSWRSVVPPSPAAPFSLPASSSRQAVSTPEGRARTTEGLVRTSGGKAPTSGRMAPPSEGMVDTSEG